MADDIDKVEKVFKAAWGLGKEFDEATGAHEAWATGAYQEDPALAQSAADDWDSGHHAKAIGKFVPRPAGALMGCRSESCRRHGRIEAMAPHRSTSRWSRSRSGRDGGRPRGRALIALRLP